MKSNINPDEAKAVCMELKYCERCGGLWLRPGGSVKVYCDRCLRILNEWPSASKRSFPKLPVGSRTTLDDCDFEISDIDVRAWPAAGGVA